MAFDDWDPTLLLASSLHCHPSRMDHPDGAPCDSRSSTRRLANPLLEWRCGRPSLIPIRPSPILAHPGPHILPLFCLCHSSAFATLLPLRRPSVSANPTRGTCSASVQSPARCASQRHARSSSPTRPMSTKPAPHPQPPRLASPHPTPAPTQLASPHPAPPTSPRLTSPRLTSPAPLAG